jgi:hypothetical protein
MPWAIEQWEAAGHQESDSRECCRFCGFNSPLAMRRLFSRADLFPSEWPTIVQCTIGNEIVWHRYTELGQKWLRKNALTVLLGKGFSDRPVHYFNTDTGKAHIGLLGFDEAKQDSAAYSLLRD